MAGECVDEEVEGELEWEEVRKSSCVKGSMDVERW